MREDMWLFDNCEDWYFLKQQYKLYVKWCKKNHKEPANQQTWYENWLWLEMGDEIIV